jgi:hypothetical protein
MDALALLNMDALALLNMDALALLNMGYGSVGQVNSGFMEAAP